LPSTASRPGCHRCSDWDGDRFAIFKRRDSDRLLHPYTSWDTDADAAQFAASYGRLLAVKYPAGDEPTRIAREGRDVLIVEGGEESAADALLGVVKAARTTRD
jgi:hypothetical protein